MRVGLEISPIQFSRAGAARYSLQILRALQQKNSKQFEIFPLWAIPKWHMPAPGLARKLWVLYWEWAYCTVFLPMRMRQLRLDVLHCTVPLPFFDHTVPRATHVIATVLDVLPLSHPEWFGRWMGWRLRRWLRHTVNHAHHTLAISAYTRTQLNLHLGFPLERCTVTYLASSITPLPPSAIQPMPYLLTVGTLEPRKNLDLVLRAYQRAKSVQPALPPLWIVGGEGWGGGNVGKLAAQLGIATDIQILGFVSDERLAELYRDARALIYPSLEEGFGLPPLEAMQCGCPVITSNTSSLPEVVGRAALMVNPLSAQELAQAINMVCDDDALVAQLRVAGMEQAAQFSWERCANETLVAYQLVASE